MKIVVSELPFPEIMSPKDNDTPLFVRRRVRDATVPPSIAYKTPTRDVSIPFFTDRTWPANIGAGDGSEGGAWIGDIMRSVEVSMIS